MDTAAAKLGRVVEGSYRGSRYIPFLDTTVSFALGATNFARQYATYGLASIVYSEEIRDAIVVRPLLRQAGSSLFNRSLAQAGSQAGRQSGRQAVKQAVN